MVYRGEWREGGREGGRDREGGRGERGREGGRKGGREGEREGKGREGEREGKGREVERESRIVSHNIGGGNEEAVRECNYTGTPVGLKADHTTCVREVPPYPCMIYTHMLLYRFPQWLGAQAQPSELFVCVLTKTCSLHYSILGIFPTWWLPALLDYFSWPAYSNIYT